MFRSVLGRLGFGGGPGGSNSGDEDAAAPGAYHADSDTRAPTTAASAAASPDGPDPVVVEEYRVKSHRLGISRLRGNHQRGGGADSDASAEDGGGTSDREAAAAAATHYRDKGTDDGSERKRREKWRVAGRGKGDPQHEYPAWPQHARDQDTSKQNPQQAESDSDSARDLSKIVHGRKSRTGKVALLTNQTAAAASPGDTDPAVDETGAEERKKRFEYKREETAKHNEALARDVECKPIPNLERQDEYARGARTAQQNKPQPRADGPVDETDLDERKRRLEHDRLELARHNEALARDLEYKPLPYPERQDESARGARAEHHNKPQPRDDGPADETDLDERARRFEHERLELARRNEALARDVEHKPSPYPERLVESSQATRAGPQNKPPPRADGSLAEAFGAQAYGSSNLNRQTSYGVGRFSQAPPAAAPTQPPSWSEVFNDSQRGSAPSNPFGGRQMIPATGSSIYASVPNLPSTGISCSSTPNPAAFGFAYPAPNRMDAGVDPQLLQRIRRGQEMANVASNTHVSADTLMKNGKRAEAGAHYRAADGGYRDALNILVPCRKELVVGTDFTYAARQAERVSLDKLVTNLMDKWEQVKPLVTPDVPQTLPLTAPDRAHSTPHPVVGESGRGGDIASFDLYQTAIAGQDGSGHEAVSRHPFEAPHSQHLVSGDDASKTAPALTNGVALDPARSPNPLTVAPPQAIAPPMGAIVQWRQAPTQKQTVVFEGPGSERDTAAPSRNNVSLPPGTSLSRNQETPVSHQARDALNSETEDVKKAQDHTRPTATCFVCLEQTADMVTPCGHTLCRACCSAILAIYQNKCPECQKPCAQDQIRLLR